MRDFHGRIWWQTALQRPPFGRGMTITGDDGRIIARSCQRCHYPDRPVHLLHLRLGPGNTVSKRLKRLTASPFPYCSPPIPGRVDKTDRETKMKYTHRKAHGKLSYRHRSRNDQ